MPVFRRTPPLVVLLVALLAAGLPRLMVAGGLPTTDEGFQAYYAQIMHASLRAGAGLPDTGPLMLYPLLLNWIFEFGANPMILLRLADMVFAVAAGYILFRVIELESRSRAGAILIALLFIFAMNQPIFIQQGFKNSIHAAYVPLFGALWLGLAAPAEASARRWQGIGALLSLAVLLRETFLPLMALGALAVWPGRGWRPFAQLAAGAAGAGVLITGAILLARGGVANAVESYRDAGLVYAAIADKRVGFFFDYGGQALREGAVAVVVAGVGLLVALARSLGGKRTAGLPKIGFWPAAALLPLIEPASKIGFPYHFGVCLPGLAGLAALGWRSATEGRTQTWPRAAAGALVLALLALVIPRLAPLGAAWPQTREALAAMKSGEWPESFTDRTNYLLAARAIRQATPPGGSVAISGFMFTLYPLTGHVPPTPELANLSATLIKLDLSGPRLREALLRCPPDVLMTTSRSDWPGAPEILAAVQATGIYEQVAEIPTTSDRAYGAFGGLVFRRTEARTCAR